MSEENCQEGMIDVTVASSEAEPSKQLVSLSNKNDEFVGNYQIENGVCVDAGDSCDQLPQAILELSFQNTYLKAQFNGLKNQLHGSSEVLNQEKEINQEVEAFQQIKPLQEKISILYREIEEQKETQKAAEDALEHLRLAYSEADAKVQDLSTKLVEAQQKMEQEIKERDEKYADLDTKFGRLHKRAKQRIQDIQKEKDDLEAQFRDATVMAERASSQQSSAQQELERARQQASEALRSMDAERQQLRTTNSKLRDSIDEMHRTLEAKDNALEELQQSLFEKEKMLEDTQHSLQASEDRKQTSIAELSSKHQKEVEDLEAQIIEAISDRSKATETISSLQVLIGEKDSRIAELGAASTGEAVRLGAAVEAAKTEIAHLKNEHEKEKASWETACQTVKAKLEASESAHLRSEIEAAKMRSKLELELSTQSQLLNTQDSELKASKDEINRLESEFSSYKVRAHALLQKKDAELHAAKDSDLIEAQEEAIKGAEREVAFALAERDKALHDLQNALNNHDKEIVARDAALGDADQRARSLALELKSTNAQYLSEKEIWQKTLENLEENWRLKCSALEAQKNEHSGNDLQSKLEDLKLQHTKLKEEHDTFRDIADRTLEEKEKEISKLNRDNKSLRQSLESRPSVNYNESPNTDFVKQDVPNLSVAAAEQQILLLARQQAQREEELAQSQRHILALQDELEELDRENRLHNQQEAMLKEELRNMERKQKREGVDMTYLKNVILKLLETGEVEALLPVVGTLLQFSPDEIRKCQQAYRATSDAPPSPALAAPPPESLTSNPLSLLSRFSFS